MPDIRNSLSKMPSNAFWGGGARQGVRVIPSSICHQVETERNKRRKPDRQKRTLSSSKVRNPIRKGRDSAGFVKSVTYQIFLGESFHGKQKRKKKNVVWIVTYHRASPWNTRGNEKRKDLPSIKSQSNRKAKVVFDFSGLHRCVQGGFPPLLLPPPSLSHMKKKKNR